MNSKSKAKRLGFAMILIMGLIMECNNGGGSGTGGGGGGGGCINHCSPSGAKQCSSNGYQTCGNYDADSCLEWSEVIACGWGETCTDGVCSGCSPQKIGSDVRITFDPNSSQGRSLVWTGTEYGLSWMDDRDGNYEIYFTRMSAAGAEIGGEVRITNAVYDSVGPTLVWTGSEYGVSWWDLRNDLDGICDTLNGTMDCNNEIYFARISSSGAKLGDDVRITNDVAESSSASLFWTGSEYGVIWSDSPGSNPGFYFARISSAGAKIGADVQITNGLSESLFYSRVWSGSEYGISWDDYRDGNWEIYFARVSASGSEVGSDVRITHDINVSMVPFLAWTGTEFGLSWQDTRDGQYEIYFARVSAAGAKLGSDLRLTHDANDSEFPSLSWTGSEFGASWTDDRDGNYDIYFARISASGTKIGSDVRITNDVGGSYWPSLVWTGSEFGAAWLDTRDGNFEIYFTRIRCGP